MARPTALALSLTALAAACGHGGAPSEGARVASPSRPVAGANEPAVVPRLARYAPTHELPALLTRASRCHVAVSAPSAAREAAERACASLGRALATRDGDGAAPVTFALDERPDTPREGYAIHVTAREVRVTAATAAGLFYGGVTLEALSATGAPAHGPARIAAAEIVDAPTYPYRGVHLDVARHFFPISTVERIVDLAARHKLNALHLHLSDDQGFRLPVPALPRLAEVGGRGGRYTREELAHLVRYAGERFVTIVPEVDLPGHMGAALASYPEHRCAAGDAPPPRVESTWGVFAHVLCPDAAGLAFAKTILDAALDAFPGPYVHVGGDEVPLAPWRASPRVAAEVRARGLRDERELLGEMVRAIAAHVRARGRTPIGWDEVLDTGAPPGAVVMAWRGEDEAARAIAAGHDAILTPHTRTYFNFYEGPKEHEPRADGGVTTLWDTYALDPDALASRTRGAAGAGRVLGAAGCLWTEYVETEDEALRQLFPRLGALAEIVWTPRARRSPASLRARMPAYLARLEALGVPYRVPPVEGLDASHVIDGDEVEVHLAALGGREAIRVTTDGSEVTAASPRYGGPLRVRLGEAPVTIRARAFSPSGRPSPPRGATVRRAVPRPADATPETLAAGARFDLFEGRFEHARGLAGREGPVASGVTGALSIPARAPAEHFGAVYTYHVCVPSEGVWAFSVTSDDGAVLSIGGEIVVDVDGAHAARRRVGRVALAKGCHRSTLEYFQGEGERALEVLVASERGAPAVIGADAPERAASPAVRVEGAFLAHDAR